MWHAAHHVHGGSDNLQVANYIPNESHKACDLLQAALRTVAIVGTVPWCCSDRKTCGDHCIQNLDLTLLLQQNELEYQLQHTAEACLAMLLHPCTKSVQVTVQIQVLAHSQNLTLVYSRCGPRSVAAKNAGSHLGFKRVRPAQGSQSLPCLGSPGSGAVQGRPICKTSICRHRRLEYVNLEAEADETVGHAAFMKLDSYTHTCQSGPIHKKQEAVHMWSERTGSATSNEDAAEKIMVSLVPYLYIAA